MHRVIDRSARLSIDEARDIQARADGVGQALRALARFTYPGLEPPTGYATGYSRTREGLGLGPRGLESLNGLKATGHAYRIGRKGWCITKRGRELARPLFGDAALAREELAEGERPDAAGAWSKRVLVDGQPLPDARAAAWGQK